MQGSNKNGGSIVGSFPLSVSNNDISKNAEVEDKKGRSNNHDVEGAKAKNHIALGADSDNINKDIVGKKIVSKNIHDRIKNLVDKGGLSEILERAVQKQCLQKKIPDVANPQSGEAGGEIASKAKDIDNVTGGGEEVPSEISPDAHDDVDVDVDVGVDVGVGVDNLVSSNDSSKLSKPVDKALKNRGRLSSLLKKFKRSARSMIMKLSHNVRSKDFKAMPANVLEKFEGTELKNMADNYNSLQNELMTMNDDEVVKSTNRKSLKTQLLMSCMNMDKEIDNMLVDDEYLKDSGCDNLSNKDRKILAEKLRSKIGFDMSSLKVEKQVEKIEEDVAFKSVGGSIFYDISDADSENGGDAELENIVDIPSTDLSTGSDEPVYASVTPKPKTKPNTKPKTKPKPKPKPKPKTKTKPISKTKPNTKPISPSDESIYDDARSAQPSDTGIQHIGYDDEGIYDEVTPRDNPKH